MQTYASFKQHDNVLCLIVSFQGWKVCQNGRPAKFIRKANVSWKRTCSDQWTSTRNVVMIHHVDTMSENAVRIEKWKVNFTQRINYCCGRNGSLNNGKRTLCCSTPFYWIQKSSAICWTAPTQPLTLLLHQHCVDVTTYKVVPQSKSISEDDTVVFNMMVVHIFILFIRLHRKIYT